ncbi:hypothetical protein BJ508DRAFT_411906 [Ascobolus immersus RN42]|uniref:Glycosyltransferase family 1 protein n=1 Tax=Ascobolus immersus RN42 TaxID=1160509 RepID=A0A3N4IH69_ASCIM|nr:hypothetical protein BJ508DRAFT_411906 [Ascobolus immersus RN42]
MMPRRLGTVIISAVLAVIFFGFYFFNSQTSFPNRFSKNIPPEFPAVPKDGPPLSLVVTETGGSHDEVVAALVHAFGAHPRAQMDLYQLLARYNITKVMSEFELPNKVPKHEGPGAFKNGKDVPDILVMTTCEIDMIEFKDRLSQFLKDPTKKTHIFCTIHHADRWNSYLPDHVIPWVNAERITFLTLSEHVRDFFITEALNKWKKKEKTPPVEVLVPVFPVKIQSTQAAANGALDFALQGDYDPSRRDYKSIFEQLAGFKKNNKDKLITMHLLGHGKKPQVPTEVQDNVIFDASLTYPDFYRVLSEQFALLPAFASAEYLDRKASSSMPASLIAGVPPLVDRAILKAYNYLREEDVWLEEDYGKGLDAVGKLVKVPESVGKAKREGMMRNALRIQDRNQKMASWWMEDIMNKKATKA